MSLPNLPPNYLNTMVGAPVIGVGFNLILYGITIMQVYQYYLDCKKDSKWMKYFVAFIFFADSLNSAFNFALLYNILIQAYVIALQLGQGETPKRILWWTGVADPSITAVISGSVQLFFAWRIHRLTRNRIITGVITTLAILQTVAGNALAYCLSRVWDNDKPPSVDISTEIWLTLALVNDIIITVTLVMHLRSLKTGRPEMDDLISRIMISTVQTGAVTAVWAGINLIIYWTEDNNLNTIFNFPLCKLYTNSLLSSLNSRSRWRSADESNGGKAITFSVPWDRSRERSKPDNRERALRPVDTNVSEIVFAGIEESTITSTIPRTDQYQMELESVKSREFEEESKKDGGSPHDSQKALEIA